MKKVLLLGLSIVALISSLLVGATAAASADGGAQVWQLDSETTAAGYQMEKNYGPGDDGQATPSPAISLAPTGSLIWIADQPAETDVTFAADGAWKFELSTDSMWKDALASGLGVSIGEWDGTFTPFSSLYSLLDITWNTAIGKYIITVKGQLGDETVYLNNYLALKITNNDTVSHIIYTGEGNEATCLTSPENDPGYPLPEIAAGILLGGGLIGLVSFIVIRKKKAAAVR
jgi:hypothetical protein